ncbi:universal stress protein [Carnimonas nigrificans]|uniref:universal stress protein n=1 Tax=Carnimonas nigrificans TaxID=64323 RepID=UPI00046E551B|nr:universal stress protein [Carnimonas nigrificans]
MPSRHILLAVDLNAHFAVTLVRYAQAFAAAMGDSLAVLYVSDTSSDTAAPHDAARQWYLQLNNQLEQPLAEGDLSVRSGSIDTTIVDEIATRNIDLLMIGAESRTSLTRLFRGTGTSKITRSAPCDVLVVSRQRLGMA